MHTRKYFASYLERDISTQKIISFNKVLELIFYLGKSDWSPGKELHRSFLRVTENLDFKEALKGFRKNTQKQKKRKSGKPVMLDEDLEFCVNNPMHMLCSSAARTPNAIISWRHVFNRGNRKNSPTKVQTGNGFHWMELLGFIEFKSAKNGMDEFDDGSGVEQLDPDSPSRSLARESSSFRGSSGRGKSKLVAKVGSRAMLNGQVTGQKWPCNPRYSSVSSSKRVKTEPSPEFEATSDLQCASYALEMMSQGGLRTHVIGFLIINNNIQILYYDRSITVKSTPISITRDPIKFVALLFVMSQMDATRWGHDPVLPNPAFLSKSPDQPKLRSNGKRNGDRKGDDKHEFRIFEGTEFKTNNVTLVLGKEMFHQHVIIGRGTCVIRARLKSKGSKLVDQLGDEGFSDGEDSEGEDSESEGEDERVEQF